MIHLWKISGQRTEPDFSKISGVKELNGYFTRFDKRSAGDEFLNRVENRVRRRGFKKNVLFDHQVRSWRLKAGDDLKILVTIKGYLWQLLKIVNIGYQNGQNSQKHLKIVTNTFRLQHPSPKPMLKFWHHLEIFIWPPG